FLPPAQLLGDRGAGSREGAVCQARVDGLEDANGRGGLTSMPVRIVVTVPWGKRLGGAESMLWNFLQEVDRERIRPLVVFFEPGPFEREVADLGIETVVVETG